MVFGDSFSVFLPVPFCPPICLFRVAREFSVTTMESFEVNGGDISEFMRVSPYS